MRTQRDSATLITTQGADYVFTVKANQPAPHPRRPAVKCSRKSGGGCLCREFVDVSES